MFDSSEYYDQINSELLAVIFTSCVCIYSSIHRIKVQLCQQRQPRITRTLGNGCYNYNNNSNNRCSSATTALYGRGKVRKRAAV